MDIKALVLFIATSATVAAVNFAPYDYLVELYANDTTTLVNPGYPDLYPYGSRVRYQVTAPANYIVTVSCNIYIPTGCSVNDCFRLATDGTRDIEGPKSIALCSYNGYSFQSEYNSVSFGHISSYYRGGWECFIQIKKRNTCECGWSGVPKIVGGQNSQPNAYPFEACLYNTDESATYCMGTIISPKCVLTAAHCIFAQYSVKEKNVVLAGRQKIVQKDAFSTDTPYSQVYSIYGFRRHELYNSTTNANDIAYVYTNVRMAYNIGVGPICLPVQGYVPPDGSLVTVAGWGTVEFGGPKSEILQTTQLAVYPIANCGTKLLPNSQLNTAQFCTLKNGTDSCQNDSGASLFYLKPSSNRFTQVGIVSYGSGCATKVPSVNTLVSKYLDWCLKYGESPEELCFFN